MARIPARLGLALSLVLFGLPAIHLWLVSNWLIPILVARGTPPLVAWFAAGATVFVLLFMAAFLGAFLATGSGSPRALMAHLRIRRLSREDWRVAAIALGATLFAMAALQAFNSLVWPRLAPHPPFLEVKPLAAGELYILLLWLPFFFFNIVGEEAWWRGFIQPRQEPVFGEATWIAQGLLHGMFHFAFGPGVLFVLVPVLFAIPWAVQRTRNTTVGMVVHAGVNGPGFLLVSLGLLPV